LKLPISLIVTYLFNWIKCRRKCFGAVPWNVYATFCKL